MLGSTPLAETSQAEIDTGDPKDTEMRRQRQFLGVSIYPDGALLQDSVPS